MIVELDRAAALFPDNHSVFIQKHFYTKILRNDLDPRDTEPGGAITAESSILWMETL